MASEQGREAVKSVDGTYTGNDAAEVMAAATAAAEKESKETGGAGTETKPAAGAAATESQPGTEGKAADGTQETKPGAPGPATGADGKPVVPAGYIPQSRLNEEVGKYRAKMEAAGLDPDTGLPKPKAAATEPAWKSKLLPKPSVEGKRNEKGELVPWDSPEEYYTALADVTAENKLIERDGKAAEAQAAKDAEAKQTSLANREAELYQEFQTKHIPEFLAAEQITAEQYNQVLNGAPRIDMPDDVAAAVKGAILLHSSNVARFLYRMGEIGKAAPEVLAKEAARILATPVENGGRAAAIIGWVNRMDALASVGLGFDGKPRAGAKGGAGGLTNGNGGGQRGSGSGQPQVRRPSEPPDIVQAGGGAVTDINDLPDAEFYQRREQQDAEARASRISRRRGK